MPVAMTMAKYPGYTFVGNLWVGSSMDMARWYLTLGKKDHQDFSYGGGNRFPFHLADNRIIWNNNLPRPIV